jgi:hypothetical protein
VGHNDFDYPAYKDASVAASAGFPLARSPTGSSSAAATSDIVAAVTADLSAAMLRIGGSPNNIPMRRPMRIASPAIAMWLA